MNFDIKRILDRGRSTLGEFTAGQKTMTVLAVVVLIVGGYLFTTWASKPSYAPLYTNLAASDASAITDKLTSAKEPYKLADGGATILVPQKDVYQLRLTMASDNLPASNASGYSLLDKGGITTSEFQQNVEYQQAIQDEMQKTIEAIDGVEAAVVHVVIPQQDVFSDDSTKPTASVLVTTDPSKPLSAEQVQAIVHLVSSSVEGLSASDVTVADSQGDVLSAPGMAASGASSMQDEQTSAYEQRVSTAVQNMLQPLVGTGHVIVQVNAALDFDTTNTTSESYPVGSPGSTPQAISQTKSGESYSGSDGGQAAGILGPDNIAVPSGSAAASPGAYQSASSTTDYAVDRVVQQVQTAPGTVQHMSVAVLLDSTAAKGVDVSQVQKLVANAAGVQTKRGDSVQVSTMPFDQSAAKAAKQQLAAAAKKKNMSTLMSYGKDGLLGVLLLAAILIFTRKAKKAAANRITPMSTTERLELEEARRMLALVAAQEEAAQLEAGIPAGGAPALARIESTRPSLDAEIGAIVEQQPEEVAQLLRGWLADRRS